MQTIGGQLVACTSSSACCCATAGTGITARCGLTTARRSGACSRTSWNLHTVVRQGLRAGVSSYSLKEVEALARSGVIVTIPALVFFIAVQRYLIVGWGAGGLEG